LDYTPDKCTMQTIVELPEFQKRALALLQGEDKSDVINFLAVNAQSGVLMQGTGGIRKLRWAANGKGKSGGCRVVYFFHNHSKPLFLLTVFGKNEKANLSKAERNELAALTQLLIKHYS